MKRFVSTVIKLAGTGVCVRGREYSLQEGVQTEPGAHSALYPVGIRDTFPEVKWLRNVDYLTVICVTYEILIMVYIFWFILNYSHCHWFSHTVHRHVCMLL
jgi:hypothetical protein